MDTKSSANHYFAESESLSPATGLRSCRFLKHKRSAKTCYTLFSFTLLPSKFERNRSFTDVGAVEPLNLSMVCRSWHSAIQSHPSLWSHTTINDYQDDQVRSSLLPYFSQRLQHSKSSPLSISLFLHRQEEDDPVVKGIIEATLAQDFRLKDVEICIENPCMETAIHTPILIFTRLARTFLPAEFRCPAAVPNSPHLPTSLLATLARIFRSYLSAAE